MMCTKRILCLVLTALMCVGTVTGCSNTKTSVPTNSSQAAESTAESVTLTMGYWGSSGEDKAFAKGIEGVAEAVPGVKEVKLQQYPSVTEFYSRIPGEIAAGTAPDFVNITNEQSLTLIKNGMVLPLDDYNLDLSALSKTSVDVWKYDSKQYGIPTTAAPATFAINVDMWKAAGLGAYPTTWEEVYEASKKLTKDGVTGLCLDIGNIYHPTQYMNSFGGGWNNGTTINSAANVDALNFIFKMFKEKLAITAKDAGLSWDGEVFANQKCAMSTGGTWYVGTMKSTAPTVNYTFVPMPGGDGKNGCTLHSYAYAVVKGTQNPELAAKVALYMARPAYQKANAEITGGRPSDNSVMPDFLQLNPNLAILSDYEKNATGFNYPVNAQFQTDFITAIEGNIYGGNTTSAKDILDKLASTYGG